MFRRRNHQQLFLCCAHCASWPPSLLCVSNYEAKTTMSSFKFAPNQVVTTAVDYMPPEISNELGNLQATKISVAAHLPMNATHESKTIKTNHWCIYVEVGKAQSVRIKLTVNVLAQSGSFDKARLLGTLNVQNLPYLFSAAVFYSSTW
jgi:hypothetical protein